MCQDKPMAESFIAITNGIVFTNDKLIKGRALLLGGSQVIDTVAPDEIPHGTEIVDAMGGYVVPGFIDLQIYGGGGRLFSADPSADAMDEIARALVKSGTTGFMITMATNTLDILDRAFDVCNQYRHPALLGLHLEGPYLNKARRGAHPAEYIRQPETAEIAALLRRAGNCLRIMTIAPEQFDRKTIGLLTDNGVLLSAGHSDASFEEATTAFRSGVRAVTHLFNAMSPLHHRNPGLPGATFQSATACASIIADGIHVDYQTLSISKKLMGDRLFLITDAVAETHEGIYTHVFQGDRYTLPDNTLSGSALTMMEAVANCVRHAGISLEEALRMASQYPASLLGLEAHGCIKPGAMANVVIFDSQYSVQQVFLEGKRV